MHHVTDAFVVGNAWPYSVLSSTGIKEFTKKRDMKSIVSTKYIEWEQKHYTA